jgi:hypothetical protein
VPILAAVSPNTVMNLGAISTWDPNVARISSTLIWAT